MTDQISRFTAAFADAAFINARNEAAPEPAAKTPACHWVELTLDADRFPDGAAFSWLIVGISASWTIDCIELAIAPHGGGCLSFIVRGDAREEDLCANLRAIAGDECIARCRKAP
jgi:hypothetical protein